MSVDGIPHKGLKLFFDPTSAFLLVSVWSKTLPCKPKAASPPSPSSPMTPAHKYFSVIWAEAIAKIPQFH
ncbi:MAG: hypothetical protein ACLFWI_13565 [Coleofasciculus sp.]|uniref:hypothetical protein n=1 Tax=Coleofasciculus sp. TaxID=3100458 RepID=UPI003A302A85